MPRKRKWFQEIIERRGGKHTGWRKSDPQDKRRRTALRAHKGDILATARSLLALANVTQDPETRRKARADADYFFRLYRKSKRKR